MAFDDVYDKVTQTFPEIETIVADSAYKRPMTMKGGHEKLNGKPSSFPFYFVRFYRFMLCGLPGHYLIGRFSIV